MGWHSQFFFFFFFFFFFLSLSAGSLFGFGSKEPESSEESGSSKEKENYEKIMNSLGMQSVPVATSVKTPHNKDRRPHFLCRLRNSFTESCD